MFWSGSGAFIRRHRETGNAQYFSWTISFTSRLDRAGARWLDVLHLSCSRQPLGPSEEPRTGEFETRLAARDGTGGDSAHRFLCLRVSAQAIDLWIAAAGPMVRSGRRSRRQAVLPMARPEIEIVIPDGMPLLDGGVIVLDRPGDACRG